MNKNKTGLTGAGRISEAHADSTVPQTFGDIVAQNLLKVAAKQKNQSIAGNRLRTLAGDDIVGALNAGSKNDLTDLIAIGTKGLEMFDKAEVGGAIRKAFIGAETDWAAMANTQQEIAENNQTQALILQSS